MRDKLCPTCGEPFHNCPSCGSIYKWEEKYCSQKCWETSEEYIEIKFAFKKIYKKLKDDSLYCDFMKILGLNGDYVWKFNEWIMNLEEE